MSSWIWHAPRSTSSATAWPHAWWRAGKANLVSPRPARPWPTLWWAEALPRPLFLLNSDSAIQFRKILRQCRRRLRRAPFQILLPEVAHGALSPALHEVIIQAGA